MLRVTGSRPSRADGVTKRRAPSDLLYPGRCIAKPDRALPRAAFPSTIVPPIIWHDGDVMPIVVDAERLHHLELMSRASIWA
jgi:hypothetical protein